MRSGPLRTRLSVALLLVLFLVMLVVGGLSIWFVDDAFERDANVLITTFAGVAAVLGMAVTMTAYRRGAPWAWWAMWSVPAFFVSHVALLGTWIPDAILAAIAVLALLLQTPRPTPAPPPS